MICYRDRNFCQYYEDCKSGDVCPRSLTPTIASRAEAFGLPVSKYTHRPSCHKAVKKRPIRSW